MLFRRTRMRITLNKLEKLWYSQDIHSVTGKDLVQFTSSRAKMKTLDSLASANCVILRHVDSSDRPISIMKGPKASLYTLERFELWCNRIVSFIAGIGATLIAQLIVHILIL